MSSQIANILTVAGSDSGGGAGIQADLKTISALGAYGASGLTALTAQNTQGVRAIHEVPSDFVRAQLDAVFLDIRINAVKVGMLANPSIVRTVGASLAEHPSVPVVLDPVMVSKSGHRLLSEEAVQALRTELIPRCCLLTPNLPEAADLLGRPEADTRDDMVEAGRALRKLGPPWVLMKGGHQSSDPDTSADVLVGPGEPQWLVAPRNPTRNTHGTGCTLSAAIATYLGQGLDVPDAVRSAKAYLTQAIARAEELEVGTGQGPVHHFHALWSKGQ